MIAGETIDTGAVTRRLRTLAARMPLRVLVVDDDELERVLICDCLRSHGIEVSVASNGQEALEALERDPVPLVLTDWQMPVMDGMELTEKLRARGVVDTCIIMLSSHDGGSEHERGYLAGVDDYLTKRRPESELLARLYAGFNTFTLRRELQEARAQLAIIAARVDDPTPA